MMKCYKYHRDVSRVHHWILGRTCFFCWTQRILNEGSNWMHKKKNQMFMQITNTRKKTVSHDRQICVSRKQVLSIDWLFRVHFTVTFQTKAKKPLYFLITFLSCSCLVMFEFPHFAWHYVSHFLRWDSLKTLKMTSAQVVEKLVANNSPSQDTMHPGDHLNSIKVYYSWVQTIFLYTINTCKSNL